MEVATKYTTVKTLRQQYIFCPQKFKDTHAVFVLNELSGSSAIVFVRTCDTCRHLSITLRNLGFGAVSIHGQMSQPKRLAALHKFKAGAPPPSPPPRLGRLSRTAAMHDALHVERDLQQWDMNSHAARTAVQGSAACLWLRTSRRGGLIFQMWRWC